mgnify:CR=1 FL=1
MNKVSYTGGAVSICSALTLTDWGILVGIATALFTFGMNVWYTRQKNAREQRLADLEEQEVLSRILAQGRKP